MTLTEQIISIAMVMLGTVLTRFSALSSFPGRKSHSQIHSVSGKGSPSGCVWTACGLLSEKRKHFYRQPWYP